MGDWAFVDDQPEPATAFAESLTDVAEGLKVTVYPPLKARECILSGALPIDGVLMDVDLSDLPGEHGSGPGLAQDIRINQENGTLLPFPVVRFAYREMVIRNIGGDASSDDLFDLKIDKEYAARKADHVRRKLVGCAQVYASVAETASFQPEELAGFLGLNEDQLEAWTTDEFILRAGAARADRPHVAAGLIMRLVTQPGPLISDGLLFVRLGIDSTRSHGVHALKEELAEYRYRGVGSNAFPLWWARGIEGWWLDNVGAEAPLASMTVDQRVEVLRARRADLEALQMPPESPGSRPWRLCSLSLDDDESHVVPVDPAYGIRVSPRGSLPPWVDPPYAALGPALEHKNDPRLSKQDLERLSSFWRQK